MGNDTKQEDNLYAKLIRLLGRYFLGIKSHIQLFLVCLLLPTLGLVYMNNRKGDTYHASFTVVYEELVRKVYGDRIDNLNAIIQENKKKAAGLMGLEEKKVATLSEVSGSNILGDKLTKDLNTDKVPFIVHMYLTDTTYITDLQNGILNYLENGNDYLREKRRLRYKEMSDEIVFIENQLGIMDSVKKRGPSTPSAKGEDAPAATQSSLYQFSYELYKKRQELVKKKEMPMNLYVIDDAISPAKNSRSYLLVIILGFTVGIIIYTILAYILFPILRYKE